MSENTTVAVPAELDAVTSGPGWVSGRFGDRYREIGLFGIYVYPGVACDGREGWELVVSYYRPRSRSPVIETADLHTTSEVVRQIEAALAGLEQ